jgi:hypothetical protein
MDPTTSQRHWFSPTPGWLVLGLLAVEGFLYLSERFHWFAFNEHKGWTVLTALASVGIVFVLMLFWLAAALVFRRRFQFSIRSLLALTVAVALPCSWLAVEMKEARKQHDALQAIEKSRGFVVYDYQVDSAGREIPAAKPPTPAWLRGPLGDDFFQSVAAFSSCDFTDAGMAHLDGLTQLQTLRILDGTQVTDAGMEHLDGLTQLQTLSLDYTQITDAGMQHLEGLTRLKELSLTGTQVTDAGLVYFKGLAQLQLLDIGHTQVTDAGLEHLRGLTRLRTLVVGGRYVTRNGVQKLEQALPNCIIYGSLSEPTTPTANP